MDPPPSILIRKCQGLDELGACVQLQSDVWGFAEGDLVPRRAFIVAGRIGGQVVGAFDVSLAKASPEGDAASLIGFAMALPGLANGKPYLHSYMLAVHPDYRNQGIGRGLKLFQREEAIARGLSKMEWTFDPLEIKNSFLNIVKLGAIVRRYAPNLYGVSSSRLQGSLPTDRLYAEWWLESERVRSAIEGKPVPLDGVEQRVVVPRSISCWKQSPREQGLALEVQSENRQLFEQAFARGLVVSGFEIDAEGNGVFQLARWEEPASSPNQSELSRYP
jgi:predicted GNAT superfamily acetyltransferase